ncbi:hypothetical protein BJV82DRAFT_584278 [Fennellomyces sp. T-0311]|nr:hypothetical protein BJV82DRAFT_584278 [Fennellomyces sp. T-0311]
MSHETTTTSDVSTALNELVRRIATLETAQVTPPNGPPMADGDDAMELNDVPPMADGDDAMELNDVPHIPEQAPTTLLTPYPGFLEALPSMGTDFSRTIVNDDTRRAFLHGCPVSMDRQLRAIQCRLSGITRPIGLFVHDVLRTDQVSVSTALGFANTIHALTYDMASVVTQTRTDNICRDIGLASTPVQDATQLPNPPLLDATRVLEQTQLTQSYAALHVHG